MPKNKKTIENIVPIITIKIPKKGKESIDIESHIIYLKVSQSSETIEYVELTLEDSDFILQNSSMFHIGATMLVSLRLSTEEKNIHLIEAEIILIENSYGALKTVHIKACSKLFRLLKTLYSCTYLESSLSSIVKKIANRHGLSLEMKRTSKKYKEMLQINETDHKFLSKIAKRYGYVMLIRGRKIIFQELLYQKKGKLHLLYSGSNVYECEVRESGIPLLTSVEVKGYDIKKKKSFSTKIEAGKESKSIDGKSGSKQVFLDFKKLKTDLVLNTLNPQDQADSKTIALAILNRNNKQYMKGFAKVRGEPNLSVESLIELNEFGTKVDGKYFVLTVDHIISQGVYNNHITFCRPVYNTKKNNKFIEKMTKPVKDMELKPSIGAPIGGGFGGSGGLGGFTNSFF